MPRRPSPSIPLTNAERDALHRWACAVGRRLVGLARRLTGPDDVEDLVQTSFVNLLRHSRRAELPGLPIYYVLAALRTARDQLYRTAAGAPAVLGRAVGSGDRGGDGRPLPHGDHPAVPGPAVGRAGTVGLV